AQTTALMALRQYVAERRMQGAARRAAKQERTIDTRREGATAVAEGRYPERRSRSRGEHRSAERASRRRAKMAARSHEASRLQRVYASKYSKADQGRLVYGDIYDTNSDIRKDVPLSIRQQASGIVGSDVGNRI